LGLQRENQVLETQEIGRRVADFSLESLRGGVQGLQTFLEGKKGAVVVFWSGVCSHCVRYDAYFNSFSQQHPELGFVAIASRQGESVAEILKTAADRALTFPILYDPGSVVAKRWFTQQTPRSFLIDSAYTLLYRGAVDNYKYPGDPQYVAYLEPAISEFLSGKTVTRSDTPSFGCAIQSVYYTLPKQL